MRSVRRVKIRSEMVLGLALVAALVAFLIWVGLATEPVDDVAAANRHAVVLT